MPTAAKYTKENVVTRLSPKNEKSDASPLAKTDTTVPTIQQKLRNQYENYQNQNQNQNQSEDNSTSEAPKVKGQFNDMVRA
jgi:hypothetical protein